jgi:hypothetical protein
MSGQLHAPAALPPGKEPPVPRVGPDDIEKRKFLTPPGLELRPFCRQPVASRYINCAILAHHYIVSSL